MNRIKIAAFATFVLVASHTFAVEANFAALDAENGFRGVRFGTQFTEFKNMKPLEDGEWTFFTRADDTLKLGSAELTTIGYGFYKDELGAIIVKAAGKNCDGTLAALKASYGKPRQPNEYVKSYFWSGDKVYLSFDTNDITGRCYATFISNPVHEKASADERWAEQESPDKQDEHSPK